MPKIELTKCHYVPILLTKAAESRGLAELSDKIAKQVVPLFVLHPRDMDWDKWEPGDYPIIYRKSMADHITKVATDLAKKWKRDSFIDASEHEDDDKGSHPLIDLITQARQGGLELVPVCGIDSTAGYMAAVRTAISIRPELCVRIPVEKWAQCSGGNSDLEQIRKELALARKQVHLVFDLGPAAISMSAVTLAINSLTNPLDWASITVAATSIPDYEDRPSSPGITNINRPEWPSYVKLSSAKDVRVPSFGDYTIQGIPSTLLVDPRFISISAKLWYLVDDYWLFAKGGLFKGKSNKPIPGGTAVIPAMNSLHQDSSYMRRHCGMESWIDGVLADIAAGGSPSSGNATTWLQKGTVHHITKTVEQVATLCAASKSPSLDPEVH